MTVDKIKDTLNMLIEMSEKDYLNALKDFGAKNTITNWREGRLSAFKLLLEHIEKN